LHKRNEETQQIWEMADELPWGETEESEELGGRSLLSCLGLLAVTLLLWFLQRGRHCFSVRSCKRWVLWAPVHMNSGRNFIICKELEVYAKFLSHLQSGLFG
jgi:hypothetical protein